MNRIDIEIQFNQLKNVWTNAIVSQLTQYSKHTIIDIKDAVYFWNCLTSRKLDGPGLISLLFIIFIIVLTLNCIPKSNEVSVVKRHSARFLVLDFWFQSFSVVHCKTYLLRKWTHRNTKINIKKYIYICKLFSSAYTYIYIYKLYT